MIANRLDNKNVLITGASSGVGLSIANQCAERGANLVLLARRVDLLEEIQKQLQKQYAVSVQVYKLDVSDTDEIKRVFTQIITELGKIDVLVNNAGYGVFRAAHEAEISQVKGMFDVNVIGFNCLYKYGITDHDEAKKRAYYQYCFTSWKNCDAQIECVFSNKTCCSWLYEQPSYGTV